MKISGGYLAGSETDWLSQHIVFPEYFRQKFYETGNLWPDFAMELGGGQNIWNFAYYGLYNPLYLLSFLLPFVKMSDYVQAVMVLTWIADGLLCYIWLKNGHFRREDSFFCSPSPRAFGSCGIPYFHADHVCQLYALPASDAHRL